MRVKRIRLPLLALSGVLLAGIGGCPLPSAQSLLKGTWELVPDQGFNGPLAHLFFTFDSTDQVSEVSYRFTDGLEVTWRRPDGSTTVDGETLQVVCTKVGQGTAFDGTLDSATAPGSAAGTYSLNLELGDLSVSIPQGSATLVKQ